MNAFLRAGVLSEDSVSQATIAGTPQGGICSPLLANIALSLLDEHFAANHAALGPSWTRAKHRRAGGPVMRLVRYVDYNAGCETVADRHGTSVRFAAGSALATRSSTPRVWSFTTSMFGMRPTVVFM